MSFQVTNIANFSLIDITLGRALLHTWGATMAIFGRGIVQLSEPFKSQEKNSAASTLSTDRTDVTPVAEHWLT